MDDHFSATSRLRLATPSEIRSAFREDVAHGLQQRQKTIPPKYFYDQQGSLLFEEICRQPEYYLTRTETAILTQHAAAIVESVGECALIELGSGSSLKTRLLLDECQRRQDRVHYIPIDISASMLEATAHKLLEEYPHLRIDALAADYLTGLSVLPAASCRAVLFLGSNLGNFSPREQEQLFRQLAHTLKPGDFLVIGLDLRKSLEVVEPAYNDAAGVTADFNLNLLGRMNRELHADFDVNAFSHLAFYNPVQHQIEMHVRSEREQQVTIRDLALTVAFRAGETIHTEISRKFDLDEINAQLAPFGFCPRIRWSDARSWFAVCLFQFAKPHDSEV